MSTQNQNRPEARQAAIYSARAKNVVLAYALWFFLGFLGAHNFYMGRMGPAVIQLILFLSVVGIIVTFVWVIIDAFQLHQWVTDHNLTLVEEVFN